MSPFRKIVSLLPRDERKRALALIGLMIVGMMLETLGIGLVIPVITLLMQNDVSTRYPAMHHLLSLIGNPTQAQLIVGAMLCLVGIYFVKNLFLAFLMWRQSRFAFAVQVQLSQNLFTTYLRQPYTFHLQRNSAQLMRNVTGEVVMFTGVINATLSLLTESLVLLGIAVLLLLVQPLGAVVVALVLGGAAWGFYRVTRARISHWGEIRQRHEGLLLQHLQQGLGGAKDVKLLGREEDFLTQYQKHNLQSAQVGRYQATLQQLPRLWLELLAVSGLAILVLAMLSQGHTATSIIPTLGLFAAAAFRLMPSVNRVLGSVQTLRFGLPVINTLYEEFKLAMPDPLARSVNHVSAIKTAIRLTDIGFVYPEAPAPALSDLSLTLQKGEFVGFIGSSGAGKSTLVDVILGLLPPKTGVIEVDGKDIQQNLRAWQNQIGYVPQAIYLTDDTLRRNVAFGLPDEQIDNGAVLRAVKAAQLDEFVSTLPEALETIVGERGIRLSGGQRQRIGIARALYHDPSILVLDEATSALDTITENGVMQAVAALQGSKTIIIVAHRLSTVAHCDRLFKLEHGRIVAEGKPHEILQSRNHTTV